MNGSVENDRTQLARILATSLETLEIMDGHSRHTYEGNRALQLAAQKLVQNIGEAASHLAGTSEASVPIFLGQRLSVCGIGLFTTFMRST